MKTREEIFAEIRNTLESEFEIPPEKIVPEARFFEDLDLDSIDAVDLVVQLKQKTGLQVSAEDFKAIRTLDDLLNVIMRLMSEQNK